MDWITHLLLRHRIHANRSAFSQAEHLWLSPGSVLRSFREELPQDGCRLLGPDFAHLVSKLSTWKAETKGVTSEESQVTSNAKVHSPGSHLRRSDDEKLQDKLCKLSIRMA